MKAILSDRPGPADTLVLADLPDPVPGPGEVLVDVAAVGLNFFDTLVIEDRYQFKPVRPFSPGGEFSGRVAALGAGVTGFTLGERVAGHLKAGAAREKLLVPAGMLVPVPDGVSDAAAAGFCITYGTSLHGLADRADLKPGETVAVLGASGGVGQATIEIAKLMGARVIACASGAEKLALCRSLGADETVDYNTEDLKERLKALTGGKGVDVIYDVVGGRYAEPALRAIAWKGRYLVVGFAAGEIPKIPLNLTLLKGCDIRGVFWGAAVDRDPEGYRRDMARLLGWIAEGKLKVLIHGEYPLAEAAAALDVLSGRRALGKVILRP